MSASGSPWPARWCASQRYSCSMSRCPTWTPNCAASAREELQQFQRRIGTTTIYVTHDQVEAMGLGDRIAVMKAAPCVRSAHRRTIYRRARRYFRRQFRRFAADESGAHRDYILGFRPESFLPVEPTTTKPKVMPFRFPVTRVEYLGADRLIYGISVTASPNRKLSPELPTTVTTKSRRRRTTISP